MWTDSITEYVLIRSSGPWFSTQLTLSLAIGLTSFFVFCFLRTRWEVVYMGRTKLKGALSSMNAWHTCSGAPESSGKRVVVVHELTDRLRLLAHARALA
jgi:hypothetical protein